MVGKSISGGVSLYLVSMVIFVIIYICFLKKKKLTIYRKIIFITLYIYIILVIEKTLMPIPVNYAQIEMWREMFPSIETTDFYNLIPSIDFGNNLWLKNMILNIIMFIPFGFLWSLYKGKQKFIYILCSSLLFTSIIELYQLCMAFTMKTPIWYFDTNDLIANMIGGVIGYIVFVFVSPYLFRKISKKEIYGGNYEENI